MLQENQVRSGFLPKVALVIGGAIFALVVAWLTGILKVPSIPHETGTVNPENPEYYRAPTGMTFRHVGPQWVRNDVQDCAGHDKEALDGDPEYYPEYCKLTSDDATTADVWWKKNHPKWSVKAAYATQERAEDRWYKRHPPTQAQTQTNSAQQSSSDKSASAEADDILRCLNVFPSNNPAKGQYMVRYRISDPTCGDTSRGRFAVGYGDDPSDAALDYAKNRGPSF
jgi:hypothetical protein